MFILFIVVECILVKEEKRTVLSDWMTGNGQTSKWKYFIHCYSITSKNLHQRKSLWINNWNFITVHLFSCNS